MFVSQERRRWAETPLFDFDLSVARIHAARGAIDDHGGGVLLTGRSEGFVVGRPDSPDTIRRLQAYAEAGADCLYAPRMGSLDDIAAVVRSAQPGDPVRRDRRGILAGGPVRGLTPTAQAGTVRVMEAGCSAE